ncbi:MAG TPA: sensor histidine kinase, partial [Orrella sp.]
IDTLVKSLVQASEQHDRIKLSCESVPVIQSDSYLIKIVLANLLDNATKYAVKGSMVDVVVTAGVTARVTAAVTAPGTATDSSSRISVRVSNEIESDAIPNPERLFERYYRHESARHIRGSGLGLPLSRSVCDLLGARIVCRLQDDRIEFEVIFEKT